MEELIEKFRYKKNKAAFAQSKIKYLDRMDRIEDPKSDEKRLRLVLRQMFVVENEYWKSKI